MNLFPKIGNGKVVKILYPEKIILNLLESRHFLKICYKAIRKKVWVK